MREDFERCLANVLVSEGGYSHDPHDPGGATMNGIVQTEYNAYRRARALRMRSVRFLTPDERTDIYRHEYWDAVQGDLLPAGLDYCVFDFGVNSGVSRALRYLHALEPGIEGEEAVDAYQDNRLSFLQGLHTWAYFGRGWATRVEKVRTISKLMIGQAAQKMLAATKPAAISAPAAPAIPAQDTAAA